LAKRAPRGGVDRDPGGRVWAGHGSNGVTRCTVVQLCGAGLLRWRSCGPCVLLSRLAVTVRRPRLTEKLAQHERRSVQVDELTGR
jgi:hypothetical protein